MDMGLLKHMRQVRELIEIGAYAQAAQVARKAAQAVRARHDRLTERLDNMVRRDKPMT